MAARALVSVSAAAAAMMASASEPGMPESPFAMMKGLVTNAPGNTTEAVGTCGHGEFDPVTRTCRCFEGWVTAGITDPVQFMEGVCEQYKCESDARCEEVLGIPGASCPVHGWSCYCGWAWAISNSGHGFETWHNRRDGKCMGLTYTFSIFIGRAVGAVMARLWMIFPPLMLLLLPFGRKRAICDHHRPSLWHSLRRLCGAASRCRGECVASGAYTLRTFMDDLAWTLFALEVGIWLYVFLATLWVVILYTWSLALWGYVLFVLTFWLLLACVAALVAMLCSSDSALGAGTCDGFSGGCCTTCDACDCCTEFGYNAVGFPIVTGATETEELLWGWPYLYDPVPGDCGDCGDCWPRGCRCPTQGCFWWPITKPLAAMLYVIPAVPENAWGGLFGFLMGTHRFSPDCWLYAGGNPFVDFMGMSWRRRADLHQDSEWRERVHRFITAEAGGTTAPDSLSRLSLASGSSASSLRSVVLVGAARVVCVGRPFDLRADRCARSSFEDYAQDECWICRRGCEEWDQWLACRHLFCRGCSSEMLGRQMSCPLCRVASSTVLRGHAHAPESSEVESDDTEATPPGHVPSRGEGAEAAYAPLNRAFCERAR